MAVWGDAICDSNVFENIVRELAVLYDSPPTVRHDVGDSIDKLVESIRLSGLYGLMGTVQAYTLGLREMFVRVHVSQEGRPSYRPVFPDMVLAGSSPDAPDVPTWVWELRRRARPDTADAAGRLRGPDGRFVSQPGDIWTLDVLDVSDPENPTYKIVEAKPGLVHGSDLTAAYLGQEQGGDAYPYRRSDGRPHLPYVCYHAQRTGDRLFDPYRWTELVDAALSLAVKSNLFEHAFMQASHPQRWMANLRPAGAEIVGGDGTRRSETPSDPAYIMVLESPDTDGERPVGQPMVGQWQPGADVAVLEEVLGNVAARLATQAGVPFSDLQRLGGTARSGAAISLTNEGKRVQQRKFSASFRDSDERLVSTTAAMVNRATGSNYPEHSYNVVYTELPLSPEERTARREDVLALLAAGLITPTKAYQELNPGVSAEQARQDLDEIVAARRPAAPPTN